MGELYDIKFCDSWYKCARIMHETFSVKSDLEIGSNL